MRTTALLLVSLLAITLLLSLATAPQAADDKDFVSLFDGKTLKGWEGNEKLWSVKDGAIAGISPGIDTNEFLFSKESYSDFIFEADAKLLGFNSGIQFRSIKKPDGHAQGYQADMGPGWWGALYDEQGRGVLGKPEAELLKKILKPEDWNHYRITAQGNKITLELNGTKTVEYEDKEKRPSGLFALQIHAGPAEQVFFKNIRLKKLPPAQ